MYVDNNWYSNRGVLTRYIGIKDKSIFGSIQHGVHVSDFAKNLGKLSIPFSKFFCWDRETFNYCKKNNIKNIVPIGAPFIYLDELLKSEISLFNPRGTLSFPAHSNPENNRNFQHEHFIKYVMDNFTGPYTACLFFLDFKESVREVYNRYGWNTVSAGNRWNLNFLDNIYKYLLNHEYIIHTELGSGFFYSLFLNKKTSYSYKCKIGKIDQYFSNFANDDFVLNQLKAFKNKNSFILDKIVNLEKGKKLADLHLGLEFKKNRNDLKKILGYNNYLKNLSAPLVAKLMDIKYKGLRNNY